MGEEPVGLAGTSLAQRRSCRGGQTVITFGTFECSTSAMYVCSTGGRSR